MFMMVRHRSRLEDSPAIHLMDTLGIMMCAMSLFSADDMNFFTLENSQIILVSSLVLADAEEKFE